MSDETPEAKNEAPNNIESVQDAVQKALDPIRDLMGALVVLERYEIEDNLGNKYEFRPVLNANQQIEVMLRMETMMDRAAERVAILHGEAKSNLREALTAAGAAAKRDEIAWDQALWMLRRAVQDKQIKDELDVIWSVMHTDKIFGEGVRDLSIKNMRAEMEERGRSPDDAPTHVLDLFGLEAILEGLVPFFARFASVITRVVSQMVGALISSQESPMPPSAN